MADCPHGETDASVEGRWATAEVEAQRNPALDLAVCGCCGGPTVNAMVLLCRRCEEPWEEV